MSIEVFIVDQLIRPVKTKLNSIEKLKIVG